MNLEELKEIISKFDPSEIKITRHALRRIQDKRRNINYFKIMSLIKTQKGLYRFSFGAYPAACCDKLNSLNNSVI